MVLFNPTLHLPDSKLRVATLISYALIAMILLASLNTLSPSSALAMLQRNGPKQYSVPSADGLWGDFIPESQTRASRGALKSMGQKKQFRENLRSDKRYLTSFPVAGWNNQVICMMHLIYFSLKTHRIPILPEFTPHGGHLNDHHAALLRFGQAFDLPRLATLLGTPIVEMTELKSSGRERADVDRWVYDDEFPQYENMIGEFTQDELPEKEEFGCWSWAKTAKHQEPRAGSLYGWNQHNTPLPENTVGDGRDLGASIKPLIALLQPGHPVTSMDPFQLAVIANYSLKTPEVFPSDHVSCVDELYYIDYREHNTEFGDDPIVRGNLAWNEVGRHMYFNPTLRKITHEVLRKTFGLDDDAEIPTFVAVHIRRGDFIQSFSLLDYSYYVAQVLGEIQQFMGFVPERILVTTDETDEEWLAELKAFGWIHIDHAALRTAETYGSWYPTLIDAVALSEGVGFVGLHHSTMAKYAFQRVRTWHGGVGRLMDPNNRAPKGYVYPYSPEV